MIRSPARADQRELMDAIEKCVAATDVGSPAVAVQLAERLEGASSAGDDVAAS